MIGQCNPHGISYRHVLVDQFVIYPLKVWDVSHIPRSCFPKDQDESVYKYINGVASYDFPHMFIWPVHGSISQLTSSRKKNMTKLRIAGYSQHNPIQHLNLNQIAQSHCQNWCPCSWIHGGAVKGQTGYRTRPFAVLRPDCICSGWPSQQRIRTAGTPGQGRRRSRLGHVWVKGPCATFMSSPWATHPNTYYIKMRRALFCFHNSHLRQEKGRASYTAYMLRERDIYRSIHVPGR